MFSFPKLALVLLAASLPATATIIESASCTAGNTTVPGTSGPTANSPFSCAALSGITGAEANAEALVNSINGNVIEVRGIVNTIVARPQPTSQATISVNDFAIYELPGWGTGFFQIAFMQINSGASYIVTVGSNTFDEGSNARNSSTAEIPITLGVPFLVGFQTNEIDNAGTQVVDFADAVNFFAADQVTRITPFVSSSPEPASLGLFGIGLAGGILAFRKRRKAWHEEIPCSS